MWGYRRCYLVNNSCCSLGCHLLLIVFLQLCFMCQVGSFDSGGFLRQFGFVSIVHSSCFDGKWWRGWWILPLLPLVKIYKLLFKLWSISTNHAACLNYNNLSVCKCSPLNMNKVIGRTFLTATLFNISPYRYWYGSIHYTTTVPQTVAMWRCWYLCFLPPVGNQGRKGRSNDSSRLVY